MAVYQALELERELELELELVLELVLDLKLELVLALALVPAREPVRLTMLPRQVTTWMKSKSWWTVARCMPRCASASAADATC